MPKRRGHNEGTIYQTAAGRWCAQVSLPGGRRTSRTSRTRRQAQDWLVQTLQKLQHGLDVAPSRITVGDFLPRWLRDVAGPSIRESSRRSYECAIRLHILPALGGIQLNRLRPEDIQQLYTDLRGRLAPATIRQIHAVLHRALSTAVRWGHIARNPADLVDPPRLAQRPPAILSPGEARRLLDGARGQRYHIVWLIALTTGMRQGEILGLRWEDLDLDRGELHVTYSMGRQAGRGIVQSEVKTASSRRTIALTTDAIAALREHRKRQLEERLAAGAWPHPELVITTSTGRPVANSNIGRALDAALRRLGLPRIRFHDLRHTAASLLLAEGAHPFLVQQLLGHSSIATTRRYSHLMRPMLREAADAMQRALGD